MKTRKFWLLDFDPEGAIYDNPAWDLPGFNRGAIACPRKPSRGTRKMRRR
jgi:hypothetical protein